MHPRALEECLDPRREDIGHRRPALRLHAGTLGRPAQIRQEEGIRRLSEERHIRPRSGHSRPAVPPEARRNGPEGTSRGDGESGTGEDGRGVPGRDAGRRSGPGRAGMEVRPMTRGRGGPRASGGVRTPPSGDERPGRASRRRAPGARLTALSGSRAGTPRESPVRAAPVSLRGLPGVVRSSMAAGGHAGHPRDGGRRARRGRCRAHDGTGRSRPVGVPAGTRLPAARRRRGPGTPGRSSSGITPHRRGSSRPSPGSTPPPPTRASRWCGG